jgi:hypothetical protein
MCAIRVARAMWFMKAKKPSVNLETNDDAAFQVRRYGWSATHPVSVLTDFEEFSIYDCRIQPNHTDKAAQGRVDYIHYLDYEKRWDELEARFSKTAVLNNQLEAWIEGQKQRGTLTVDQAFLSEMESWRVMLANDIALHNPVLTPRQLNMAVQSTIDRIVFLRICEDREIEPYGGLQRAANRRGVYAEMLRLFRLADDRYNSGLFHFKNEPGRDEPDLLSLHLEMSDDTLQHIITRMYYPNPYAFDVIPADILGQIYERFLGKVIELQPGKGAVVIEKPEVRKAGGVYYTPTYIVDYIVQNTVGRLVEGKTPDEVAKLKVLDPACGSGSFLLGAFQFLINWHLEWYEADGITKYEKAGSVRPLGDIYTLTTHEKKRILVNNLYGVDLDQQAVEVTKLSLLLKVLEGETAETTQLNMFKERVLPDLDDNIKWGNSLIGPDFYLGKQMSMFDDEETYRVKVFDWHSNQNGFGDIMANGGFDAVIGNPPYIRIQTIREWAADSVEFYKSKYVAASKGNYDIYVLFVEKGLQLLNQYGRLGFILPHKFFNAQYGEALRSIIACGGHLKEVVHFGDLQVFDKATTYTCLMFLTKTRNAHFDFNQVTDLQSWHSDPVVSKFSLNINKLSSKDWNFSFGEKRELLEKLSQLPVKLGDLTKIFQGLVTGADSIFILEEIEPLHDKIVNLRDKNGQVWPIESSILKPFLKNFTVSTFTRPISRHWLLFPYFLNNDKVELISASVMETMYPKAWNYLQSHSDMLRQRENGKWHNDQWYAFGRNQNLNQMQQSKLIIQVISLIGRYTYDDSGIYFTGGGNGPYYGLRWLNENDPHSIHYLQALLSSKVIDMYLHSISSPFRGGYWSYGKRFIEQLPIRLINFDDPIDREKHDKLVEFVKTEIDLHQQFAATSSDQIRKTIQSLIEQTDREIEALVYELYSLTDEEIAIVEGRKHVQPASYVDELLPPVINSSDTNYAASISTD